MSKGTAPAKKITVAQAATLLIVSLVFAAGIAEIASRALGFKPWGQYKTPNDEVPLMTYPHPERSWANLPGEYDYPGYSAEVESIRVTIFPDEGRRTGPDHRTAQTANDSSRKKIVFVGGSGTMGFAISDHETFAWKLQERYPDTDVYNFGTPGYGTYQSLLVLEDKLPQIRGKKVVLYGYIGHHMLRNVASASWVRTFAIPGKDGRLPPFATLDENGNLVRHPVSNFPPWPFKEHSAVISLLEDGYISLITRDRGRQKYAVTEQIVLEMDEFSAGHDAEFVVVLLNVHPTDPSIDGFREFLRANDVRFVDCIPGDYSLEFQVKGEGHPNGKMNTRWADCIADYLDANNL